jgi:hypothetical protein
MDVNTFVAPYAQVSWIVLMHMSMKQRRKSPLNVKKRTVLYNGRVWTEKYVFFYHLQLLMKFFISVISDYIALLISMVAKA